MVGSRLLFIFHLEMPQQECCRMLEVPRSILFVVVLGLLCRQSQNKVKGTFYNH